VLLGLGKTIAIFIARSMLLTQLRPDTFEAEASAGV